MISALLFWCLLAVDTAKPIKPRIEVKASPRIGFSPLTVAIRARVVNPGPIFWCPEVTWEVRPVEAIAWDRIAAWSEDCDPYEMASEDEKNEDWRAPIRWIKFGSGEYEIRVSIDAGGQRLSGRTTVIVKGPTLQKVVSTWK